MSPSGARRTPREEATFVRTGRRFRAPLLSTHFPSEVPFGFLGRLLLTSETVELSLEAYRLAPAEALSLVHGSRLVAETELTAGGNGPATSELEAERETAEELGRALARRSQDLWRAGLVWSALASSRGSVERVRARLADRLSALGFRVRIPRFEASAALAPVVPGVGGARPSGYWQCLPTDGLAALFPFGDETVREEGGILVGLGLSDASPVFLDRWSHASHSWGIFGTTGAGKSFATALYLLRTRWMRPETSAIILDPLGEFAPLVQELGGTVLELGREAGPRLNPLDPATAAGDPAEKSARVGAMLRALWPSLRDEEVAALDASVSRLYAGAHDEPTFQDLIAELGAREAPSGRLATLLEVFRSGSLRSLNGRTEGDVSSGLISVSFRGVAIDHLPFHLAYLLDWAYGRIRNGVGPKLLVVDEAHLLARHPSTLEFLDRVVRHVRHFRAGVIALSQSPDDFLVRESGRSLLRNLSAVALLRLPHVSSEVRAFFGLTSAEAEWLPKARLPREVGYAESLWRLGELHLPLAVVASTPEYKFLSETLGRVPGPPGSVGASASPTGPL